MACGTRRCRRVAALILLVMVLWAVLPLAGCGQQETPSASGLGQAGKLDFSFEREGETFSVSAELGAGEDAATRVFCFRFSAPQTISGLVICRKSEGGTVEMSMGGPAAEVAADSTLLVPLRALCPGGAELCDTARTAEGVTLSLKRGDDESYTLVFGGGGERPTRIVYRYAGGSIELTVREADA